MWAMFIQLNFTYANSHSNTTTNTAHMYIGTWYIFTYFYYNPEKFYTFRNIDKNCTYEHTYRLYMQFLYLYMHVLTIQYTIHTVYICMYIRTYGRCQNKICVPFRTDEYETVKRIVPFRSFFRLSVLFSFYSSENKQC